MLKIMHILFFYPILIFGQGIDSTLNSEYSDDISFIDFSVSYCNSTFKVDSIGNVEIVAGRYNSILKVNSGLYRGKISHDKLDSLKRLLFEYKIFRLPKFSRGDIPMDGYPKDYILRLENKTIHFNTYVITDNLFHSKLNTLLFSKESLINYELVFQPSNSSFHVDHKIVDKNSLFNQSMRAVIGKTELIKSFSENEYLYSMILDSICTPKFITPILKPNDTIFIKSTRIIDNNKIDKVGLIITLKTIIFAPKTSFNEKKSQYHYFAAITEFDPLGSFYFEFYEDAYNFCFNQQGEIAKWADSVSHFEKSSNFSEFEKTLINLLSK